MQHKGLLITIGIILIIGASFLFGMIAYLAGGGVSDGSDFSFGGRIGIVTVDGTLISADDTVEDIEKFKKNDDIKGVVLRIESPGGSVATSQEIFEAVKRLVAKKPVVASMGSVAASGGYYIALPATKVLANPGTITGSIGVRMDHVMLADLLKWMKVDHETLKSGKFKDIASIDRPMTPEERKILQVMLDDIHVQFKEAVAASRKLPMEKVEALADGRVYTGRQAIELGLIDQLGGLADAVELAGKLSGIKGEPKTVKPKKKHPLMERVFESAANVMAEKIIFAVMDKWQPVMAK